MEKVSKWSIVRYLSFSSHLIYQSFFFKTSASYCDSFDQHLLLTLEPPPQNFQTSDSKRHLTAKYQPHSHIYNNNLERSKLSRSESRTSVYNPLIPIDELLLQDQRHFDGRKWKLRRNRRDNLLLLETFPNLGYLRIRNEIKVEGNLEELERGEKWRETKGQEKRREAHHRDHSTRDHTLLHHEVLLVYDLQSESESSEEEEDEAK